ncbi:MAG: Xaa-Pro peptidase family protein [Candidatus Gottesmanbacteria bacterium]|nr:Xaa-Pro peptidase family protein [Candidatus Gottesmanbacteria bacterium]
MNLLVTNPANIRYLTGFAGVENRDAYVLLTKNKTYFFTNSLYLEQAKALAPILISEEQPISLALKDLCEKLKIKKLGFEEKNLTVAELEKLKNVLDGVTLVPTRDRIEKLRQIKRPDEITNIKKACAITDSCFNFIIKKLKIGVTENIVAWEIETFFRKNNATSAFSPIVAFGKNTSMPHHQSGTRPGLELEGPALILLDFGAKINGYCADMTRVVFIGKPKDEWLRAYDTVMEAQKRALDLLTAGERSGAKLDEAARGVITKANLPPYPHSLGHTIGLEVHDGLRLTIKKDETLLPGMVFSIEPGVYLAGRYGIRIEDLVRLTDTGIEVLTRSPNDKPYLYQTIC